MTISVIYTIMSTSIVFLIKVSTQRVSTMVFEPCVLSPPPATAWSGKCFSQSQYKVFFYKSSNQLVIFTSVHLYPLLQRVWYQQAMVLHASSIYMHWWVQILCWIWKIFSKWEILKFVWIQVLKKSFSLNPEWNKQKENDYLLTIVFLFHAIIVEAQSSVFYVTHALPFKIWTKSIFMVFDPMLFEDLEI